MGGLGGGCHHPEISPSRKPVAPPGLKATRRRWLIRVGLAKRRENPYDSGGWSCGPKKVRKSGGQAENEGVQTSVTVPSQ